MTGVLLMYVLLFYAMICLELFLRKSENEDIFKRNVKAYLCKKYF